MALKTNYEIGDRIYEDCYLKITKIATDVSEYEHLGNSDDGSGHQVVEWEIRYESVATVAVYVDEVARINRAMALTYFSFPFEYTLDFNGNIFAYAYEKMKERDGFEVVVDV